MTSTYGLDIREALWGEKPMGLRRLIALVQGLSPTGPLARSVDPQGAGSGWDVNAELLSTLAELVDAGNRILFMANSKKGTRQPEAIRINRPWQERPERRQATMAEVRAFMKAN